MALAAVSSGCSWGRQPDSPPPPPASGKTEGLLTEVVRAAPQTVDSITNLLWTAGLTLVLLAFVFRRSRAAMAFMLVALWEAFTLRIQRWGKKEKEDAVQQAKEEVAQRE